MNLNISIDVCDFMLKIGKKEYRVITEEKSRTGVHPFLPSLMQEM